jgi:phenylacetyl-CoA:acceptor oxidoreductase subunit 2
MAREAWIALIFFPVAALADWFETPALLISAAVLGGLFLFSQAMILKEARGIPAWRALLIVPLMLVTGAAEGSGLLLCAAVFFPSLTPLADGTAIAVVILAALRGWTFRSYVTALTIEGAPMRALAVLDAFSPWLFMFGTAAPVVLVVLSVMIPSAAVALLALAGISSVMNGAALKFTLVTRAGYNQGFALSHTPGRGRKAAERRTHDVVRSRSS